MQNFPRKKIEQSDLMHQVEQLQKEITSLQAVEKRQEVHYHFHVEQIQVEHVNLEQLLFQLEKMHTEHLNGTLNFGNNLGTTSATGLVGTLTEKKAEKVPKVSDQIDISKSMHVNIRSRE